MSKEGCHLCERAIETLFKLSPKRHFDLEVIDITNDEKLFKKYFLKIPVVLLDGLEVFQAEDIALISDCERNLGILIRSLT